MTFDNSRSIIGLRIKLFAATILFLAYITLAYVAKLIKFPLFGISDTICTLVLVAVYLTIAILPVVLNYQYIFFSDETEKIIFRFFTSGIIGGRKNSVEIEKNSFGGYKIEAKFFGLIQNIILFQKFREGIAKYPPISISALPKNEREKLVRVLNTYASPV